MQDTATDFLVVEVGDQTFAIATASVQTVVATRPVTPLPFVPAFLEGLVNINERIVPQIDLHQLLLADTGTAKDELVLVETSRSPCALRVSRIVGKAEVAGADLQPIATEADALPVSARFEADGRNVLVLDTERLGSLVGARELPAGERGLLGRLHTEIRRESDDTLDCIVIVQGGERYVMALADLVEILDLPPATPVPGTPAEVEGLAMVRDDVLLVLSLARLLGLPERVDGASRSVVVIRHGDTRYGLRVDGLDGIRLLDEKQLRRIAEGESEVSGVLAAEAQLFGLLTPARLITAERHCQLAAFAPQNVVQVQRQEKLHTVLQVELGDEAFGIALDQVRRITAWSPPERVAEGDGLVASAVNIDGRILPVAEVAGRLGADAGNDGAWVIVGEGGHEWAIAVRAAADIVDIPESALQEIGAGPESFVRAVASVDNRLLSLLNLAPLMQAGTRGAA